MKFLVILAFALCCNAGVIQPNLFVYPYAQQYRAQDVFGQDTFGYYSLDHNHQQTRLADGTVIGYYSTLDANGKPAITFYEAGRQGYRVTGSNNLPVAPEAPPAPELKRPDYTPEVAKARAEFQEKFDEAAGKTRTRRDTEIRLPYLHAVPTVAKHTFETKQFEPVEAATPADTKKIDLTTKQHEINVPAVKYVQPVVNVKPITYTAASPAVLPYTIPQTISQGVLPYTFPINYGFPYQATFPFVAAKAEE